LPTDSLKISFRPPFKKGGGVEGRSPSARSAERENPLPARAQEGSEGNPRRGFPSRCLATRFLVGGRQNRRPLQSVHHRWFCKKSNLARADVEVRPYAVVRHH